MKTHHHNLASFRYTLFLLRQNMRELAHLLLFIAKLAMAISLLAALVVATGFLFAKGQQWAR